jgi:hypothetical protein
VLVTGPNPKNLIFGVGIGVPSLNCFPNISVKIPWNTIQIKLKMHLGKQGKEKIWGWTIQGSNLPNNSLKGLKASQIVQQLLKSCRTFQQ